MRTRRPATARPFLGRIRSRQGPPPTIGPHPPPAAARRWCPRSASSSLDGVDDLRPVVRGRRRRGSRPWCTVGRRRRRRPGRPGRGPRRHVGGRARPSPRPVAAGELLAGPGRRGGAVLARRRRGRRPRRHLGHRRHRRDRRRSCVDAAVAGGRGTSLLPARPPLRPARRPPRRHPERRAPPRPPTRCPSNRVLVTGPSRTGDIEQIITLGVHGPTALHIALT